MPHEPECEVKDWTGAARDDMFCTVLVTILNVLLTAILSEILSSCRLLSSIGEPNQGQAHRVLVFLNFLVVGDLRPALFPLYLLFPLFTLWL